MLAEVAIFTCSICGEPSHEICVSCTKDTCHNHHCRRCKRCSDCCECEVPLSELEPEPEVELDPQAHSETPAPVHAEHAEQQAVLQPAPPEATEEPDWYSPPAQVMEKLGEPEHPTIGEHPTSSETTPPEPRSAPEEPGSERED